jgi:hypothetical protein
MHGRQAVSGIDLVLLPVNGLRTAQAHVAVSVAPADETANRATG